MSKTIRIRTTPNGSDNYIKVKIDQEFDFIETLSLKISQEEAYRNFCSDYGVIIGRVIVNNGFGVPNARVSVFIPIDEVDKNNPIIKGLYPYEIVTDKDMDGIRYNLLPKNNEKNDPCFTPIGTMPTKREILDNPELEYIFTKYYKFTATTNKSGDFMLFGVPVGNHTIHADVDISDIGIVTQKPYDLISTGTPEKFFESPIKFKYSKNIDSLVQVKSLNTGVNVQPFWGDTESCEVGINRVDLDLNLNIKSNAIFMGSIFGDSDTDGVSNWCRPRRVMGTLCDQITTSGRVDMIRETTDGNIERFDIDGGDLIDEDGTWAFQIPMNLDYVVTDEFGKLVPSDNPSVGIATRANVRFRIGMNQIGDLENRTRANYLIPNNPTNTSEIDYEFGTKTKPTSLRSIYWNKIYTVSSFISRFQASSLNVRNFVGVKDVNACTGDKTPFPYNRVDSSGDPLYFFLCILLTIVLTIVLLLNTILVPLLNLIILILNAVLATICLIIFGIGIVLDAIPDWIIDENKCDYCISPNTCCNCTNILPYLPCISLECPSTNGNIYAPGCFELPPPHLDLLKDKYKGKKRVFYPGDGDNSLLDVFAGADDCLQAALAEALNVYRFDFYNDWVTGTLYAFLVQFKKKSNSETRFCEYDCEDFQGSDGYSGVDTDNAGDADNPCFTNYLLDSCYDGDPNTLGLDGSEDKTFDSGGIKDGVVKNVEVFFKNTKVEDVLYYAASRHNAQHKLFATELTLLGSTNACDWQDIPTLFNLLKPTTYKLPQIQIDYEDPNNASTAINAGMVELNNSVPGLFFSINCIGITMDYRQCLNVRHSCEYGVNLDDAYVVNGVTIRPNYRLDYKDIDNDTGVYFRDVFYSLNKDLTYFNVNPPKYTFPSVPYNNYFNTRDKDTYNYDDAVDNGLEYSKFRGYGGKNVFSQPSHSYYFYFGIIPGASALEKLNQRYYGVCNKKVTDTLTIKASSVGASVSNPTGSISFEILFGTAPFAYTVSGPNGFINNGTVLTNNLKTTISNLNVGTYTITVTDKNGNTTKQTATVASPPKLSASASVSKNASNATVGDGEIRITSIDGGCGNYSYQLFNSKGLSITSGSITVAQIPFEIKNLLSDMDLTGYKLTIKDSCNNSVDINNLKINGPTPLVITETHVDIQCYGGQTSATDGIIVTINGGKQPFIVTINGPNNYKNQAISNNGENIKVTQLFAGQYNIRVEDSFKTVSTITSILKHLTPKLEAAKPSSALLAKQCDPNQYIVPIDINSGVINNNVYLVYAIGSKETLVVIPYVPNTQHYFNIPSSQLSSTDKMRVYLTNEHFGKDKLKTCIQTIPTWVNIDASEIELPNTFLSISDKPENIKQCSRATVTFNFGISHTDINIFYVKRFPYTLKYKINNGPEKTVTITTPKSLYTFTDNIPQPLVGTDVKVSLTLTDRVGCTTTKDLNIKVPALELTGVINRQTLIVDKNNPNLNVCTFTVVANGGIGTLTPSKYVIYDVNDKTTINAAGSGAGCPNPSTVSTTIVDSVGCSIILNG